MTDARLRTLDPADLAPLSAYLTRELGAESVAIARARLLSGGAVQENWSLDVEVIGGPENGLHRWVLRTDAAASLPVSLDRTGEFAVLEAVHAAGVPVARPVHECSDAAIIGAPFMVQDFAAGFAQARRITRADDLASWGPDVAADLARALAKIHAIEPGPSSGGALGFLPQPLLPPARAEVAKLRGVLDGAGEARPALEYILAWLDAHAPASHGHCLVHGDFRTGNYLIEAGRLCALLDWEFAHWGDPHEDVGWFSARCWRFGNDDREAGGIATLETFLEAYASAGGRTLDRGQLRYWQVMAAAKWAAIAVLQGDRYRRGGEEAIELVLTGLMPPEMELDALLEIEAIERAISQ